MNSAIDPWAFVIAAYGVAIFATVVLLASSYAAMRRAEAAADAVTRK